MPDGIGLELASSRISRHQLQIRRSERPRRHPSEWSNLHRTFFGHCGRVKRVATARGLPVVASDVPHSDRRGQVTCQVEKIVWI